MPIDIDYNYTEPLKDDDGNLIEVVEPTLPIIRNVVNHKLFMSLTESQKTDYLKQTSAIGCFDDRQVMGVNYTVYASNNQCMIMDKLGNLYKTAYIRKNSQEVFYETNISILN